MKNRRNENKRTGFRLKISPVLYVMAFSFVAFGYMKEVVSYLVAIILHELAHAAVSRKLGYALSEMRLMPYGAALIGEYESASSSDEIAIAAAGPLCSLSLVIITLALWRLFPSVFAYTEHFAAANMSLFAVNVLPVYPLDGGRILLAAIGKNRPKSSAKRTVKIVSYAFGGIFAALFFVSVFFGANFSFATMSAFIISSAAVPSSVGEYESVYRSAYRSERIERGLKERKIIVFGSEQAKELRKMMSSDRYTVFRVVTRDLRFSGEITESDVDSAFPDECAAEILEKTRRVVGKARKI